MFKIIEFFTFMARMMAIYDPAESIEYRLTAGPLCGRKLVTTNPEINIRAELAEEAREGMFNWERSAPIREFQATWKDDCAAALKCFFELFPGQRATLETLRNWVERFQKRDFGR